MLDSRSHTIADKTNNRLGVNEMLIASSINGFLFALVSGQPLLILGPTGPFLVFEEMVYDVSVNGSRRRMFVRSLPRFASRCIPTIGLFDAALVFGPLSSSFCSWLSRAAS